MGGAVGETLALAVAVAICPIPIVAVVLLLGTPRGRTVGPMFVVGWVLGLAVVGAVVLAIAGPSASSSGGAPASWVSWVKVAIAIALVAVAIRELRARDDAAGATPRWLGAIDAIAPARALGLGAALSGVNPKSLLLVAAGAATIASSGIPLDQQVLAFAVFAAVGTLGVATPVVVAMVMGERAVAPLERLKGWMLRHNAVIMGVLCIVIAAKLLGDAVTSLTA